MITIYTQVSSSRRLQLTPHSGPRPAFVSSFRAAIYSYIAHAHGAKWQDRQFRACLASFPIGVVVSVVDFAENYTFAPQNEIQSEYYFSEQVRLSLSYVCHLILMYICKYVVVFMPHMLHVSCSFF